jgi:hypothetical protein
MKLFIKRLFCRHEFIFGRNIYGDEIINWGYKRSLWRCNLCGKIEARDELHEDKKINTQTQNIL